MLAPHPGVRGPLPKHTPVLVDAIWQQAAVRIAPHPLPPGPQMMSNDYYRRHADMVDGQLAGKPPGADRHRGLCLPRQRRLRGPCDP